MKLIFNSLNSSKKNDFLLDCLVLADIPVVIRLTA